VVVVDIVSGGVGNGVAGGTGEAIERVQIYNIQIFIVQTPSKVMCNDINETLIPN
jgi:hypothetical protein